MCRVLDPVFHGDYPKIMKELVGNRLLEFTQKEKRMLKGSTNFIGINYYTSHFARHEPNITKIMADNYDALAVSEGKFFLKLNSTFKQEKMVHKIYRCKKKSIKVISQILHQSNYSYLTCKFTINCTD